MTNRKWAIQAGEGVFESKPCEHCGEIVRSNIRQEAADNGLKVHKAREHGIVGKKRAKDMHHHSIKPKAGTLLHHLRQAKNVDTQMSIDMWIELASKRKKKNAQSKSA